MVRVSESLSQISQIKPYKSEYLPIFLLMVIKLINKKYNAHSISILMSYQQIQNLIDQLKSKPSVGLIKKLLKHFGQYVDLQQNLPAENLLPFAIFEVPNIWNKILNTTPGQPLEQQPHLAASLQLQAYLNIISKLLTQADEDEIKIIVLEGMGRCFHLTLSWKKIYKTWLKQLIDVWAVDDIKVKVRAFNVINKYLRVLEGDEVTWVLRRCYVNFVENAKHVNWRNYEYLNLMINCYCEFIKHHPSNGYYVTFGHLRMIVVQIEKTLKESKTKKKELIKKLYSFEILNCFRLITAVVTRIDSEQLTSLIYPLVQSLEAYSKLNLSTEYIPLRLHIINLLIEITERTGVFIPFIVTQIQQLLSCKQFYKNKPKTGAGVKSDLALIFQISEINLKNTSFWGELFDQILKKVYWISNLYSRMIAGAEIFGSLSRVLKRIYNSVKFAGYKVKLKEVIRMLKNDMMLIAGSRNSTVVPSDKKAIRTFQTSVLENLKLEIRKKHEKILEDELKLLKMKLQAEFQQEAIEDQQEEIPEQQNAVVEDIEGASEYEPSENEEPDDEENKGDISYEGDPENPEELLNQWSQHQWSSQNDQNQHQIIQ